MSSADTKRSAPQGADPTSEPRGAGNGNRRRESESKSKGMGSYGQDVRELKDSAKTTVRGGLDSFTAMRRLAMAELNLSRHAAGQSMVWLAVGIVFGASFWLLLMAGTVVAMHEKLEWSWLVSLLVAAGVSLAITLLGAWRAKHYFDYTGLRTTRRELARFGFGETDDDDEAKPSFPYLQRRVQRAERVAEGRREQTLDALASVKQKARDTMTPGRILAAGAVSGFVVGRQTQTGNVTGRIRRTGLAARSMLLTTDTALRGLSELASLAMSTFAAMKSADAAEQSAETAEAVTEPSRTAAWNPEDPGEYRGRDP